MGTRNLTAVMIGGEYKVAQYGQWDGYPSGQGVTALDFLRHMGRKKFERRLKECEFIPQTEVESWATKYIGNSGNSQWLRDYPYATRDHGAEVLGLIYRGTDKPRLKNSIDFAGESLMCEYAYVVDLDKNTFEVYRGFNKEPHTGERFSNAPTCSHEHDEYDDQYKPTGKKYTYAPVKHWRTFRLSRLPSDKHFLKVLKEGDDE